MRPTCATAAWIALLALAAPSAARAGPLEEARAGVMAHNTCVLYCDNSFKEDGVNVTGELVFASPDALRWVLRPRPYLMASVNTAGETSYAGGGVAWRVPLARSWAVEPGLGYVVHSNDELDNPYPPSDPRRGPFQEDTLLLGSRDLFRLSLAVSRDVTDAFGVQLVFEHLSHGQIIGEGRNQGLDELGMRFTYRFRD